MTDLAWQVDVAVIGAGPAGCSAALWLSEMGFSVALVEKAGRLLARLDDLQLPQNWVLGAPATSTADLARQYAAHIEMQPGIRIALGETVAEAWRSRPDGWRFVTTTGRTIKAGAVIVATGLQARTFGASSGSIAPFDAQQLVRQRAGLPVGRFLLLGGGDNAVENAVYLARAGHAVTLWSRDRLRAQSYLIRQLDSLPLARLCLRIAQPMPERLVSDMTGWQVESVAYGAESFDHVAVLFGNAPDRRVLRLLAGADGAVEALPQAGVFVAGDLSGRWHPCISTAIADGVETAKQVQRWLQHELQHDRARLGSAISAPASGQQTLSLTGLRFAANVGILAHERDAPQPIEVDAELNLGPQPLAPRDDDITHVLDYRKVRQIIIDECTARHVNLLESLAGKVCARLLQLPGVQGVRVKIVKLEIFDDCAVAIRLAAGNW
ncbi:MAG: FAD-dependent oxidoreductase [Azonexus sp.]|jgi:dihydroneopterin aldolase|nr:FAD-dependent oxidoreductase [Azonexus sp.]